MTGFGKRVFAEFSEKNVTFMAAGLAYNAFVSLVPLLVLVFLVLTTIGGGLEDRIIEAAGTWLPGPIAEVVRQLFAGEGAGRGASVVGLIVVVWGTLKIFRGLDVAFSEIYETAGSNDFTDKLRDAVVVLVALVVAIVATVGASAAFAAFSDAVPYLGLLTPLVLVAGLALAFLPMFYVFPDTEVGVRDVLPGVVFAAVGWAAFQALFQVYLAFSDPGSGSFFGGVVVVITYLYFSALVLLLGAVINAVAGDHSSGVPGGIGAGATGYETRHDGAMSTDRLAAYLNDLREDLTGYHRKMESRTDGAYERQSPDSDVVVVEQTTSDDGERTSKVTLQWTASEDGERQTDER
ncbi:YihY/virulence factor BrkB family protein [Halobacterium sp. R2-5]|uniref:YihY/virulence factor BrkB family protein n=1 Tax=Halobacterium sp. R2-5 TaxID=2715751 RepID=UPI003266F5DF